MSGKVEIGARAADECSAAIGKVKGCTAVLHMMRIYDEEACGDHVYQGEMYQLLGDALFDAVRALEEHLELG